MIHSIIRFWWWLNAKKLDGGEYVLLLRSAVAHSAYRYFGPERVLLDRWLGREEQALTAYKMLSMSRPANPRYRKLHAALKEFTRFQAQVEAAHLAMPHFEDSEAVMRRLSRALLRAEGHLMETGRVVNDRLRSFDVIELAGLFGLRLTELLSMVFCHESVIRSYPLDMTADEIEALMDEYKIPLHCSRCGESEATQLRVAVEGMEEEATRVVRRWHELGCRREAA